MRLVYFVHNLNDPAVARRVRFFEIAGIDVCVAGFWRDSAPPTQVHGARVISFGRTHDGALVHRAATSLLHVALAARIASEVGAADLFVARNLEMLAIAHAAARRFDHRPALIYEVLDIHRLLIAGGAATQCLRRVERALLRDVDLLIVSSPAFLREYFRPLQLSETQLPLAVVENKVIDSWAMPEPGAGEMLEAGPPWHIGWLGVIRCRKSFAMLAELAKRRPELVRVQIFGRPTHELSSDIASVTPDSIALRFGGAYAPADLSRLYRLAHFNWAIDYYEEGANSRWLLPNRIYEGGCHGVVPLAQSGTETARWLEHLGLGVYLDDPSSDLEPFLERLTPSLYADLKRRSLAAPRSAFVVEEADCDKLRTFLVTAINTRARRAPDLARLPEAAE